MWVIRYKKIFFILAVLLVIGSLAGIIWKGFALGIDFTGGSVLEVTYQAEPNVDAIRAKLLPVFPDARVQAVGSHSLVIRTEPLTPEQKTKLTGALASTGAFHEDQFTSIGPSVGSELRRKAILALVFVSFAIILFIAFAFRTVSKPVSSWVYGLLAIVVLVHDVLIPAGVFAWFGLQVDTLFVVGLLTIVGVSVHDTIVVFDRVRENLSKSHGSAGLTKPFSEIVGASISETFTRSIMTSVTVFLALIALLIWGPESTRNLSLVMFLGMFFGTYSSIFLAAPLLTVWEKWRAK